MESQFDRDEVLGKGAYLGTIGLIQLVVRSPSKVIRDPFNKLESARHPDLRGNHNNNRTGKSVGRIIVKCSKYLLDMNAFAEKESIFLDVCGPSRFGPSIFFFFQTSQTSTI